MSKSNLVIVGLILIIGALGCKSIKSLMPGKSASTSPLVDLDAPAAPRDVKIQLDKKQTGTGKATKNGGSVTLSTADGSKFTLDVPAGAVEAETDITMTAVKSVDGAPLDNNSPTAVQLEPSGLFFKQLATLTIVPSKDIPIKQQLIFGYEGDGKDYHLAQVDPKSKEIKIKLMRFSGAGVGTASEAAWAQNLMIQAREAGDRIGNRLAQYTQEIRTKIFTEDEDSIDWDEVNQRFKSYLDQLEDQVVRKEEAAAELDCKHAVRAVEDLIQIERQRQILGIAGTANFEARVAKLKDIGQKCSRSYRVNGSSGGASFKGEICSLAKPFVITMVAQWATWPLNFTPASESGGQMEGHITSQGITVTGSGPYTISLGPDGSGTISWKYNSTSTSGPGSMSKSVQATLPLVPAMDLSCQ